MQIRDAAGNIVYDRTVTMLQITGDGGRSHSVLPGFIPQAAGTYCVTACSNYAQEPVRSNDTVRWCFNVKPALSGTIRVGFGERYRTIQEARDSLFYYGVGGPLTFELVDDSYTIAQTEATTPALDFRGRVVGLEPSNPVVWKPVAGKTLVTVNLKSASGIGMWYGQLDTSNPNGYITWDGGANKALHFIYREHRHAPTARCRSSSAQGASNYTIKNLTIEPLVNSREADGNDDLDADVQPDVQPVHVHTGSEPVDLGRRHAAQHPGRSDPGRTTRPDTLRNQNNTINNVTIRNFAYGILSVGAGPSVVVCRRTRYRST